MVGGDVLVRAVGFHIIAQVEVFVPQPFSRKRLARPNRQMDALAAGALAKVLEPMIAVEVGDDEVARRAKGLGGINDGDGRSDRWQRALDEAEFVECLAVGSGLWILAAVGQRTQNFGLCHRLPRRENNQGNGLARGKIAIGYGETNGSGALAGDAESGVVTERASAAVSKGGKEKKDGKEWSQ